MSVDFVNSIFRAALGVFACCMRTEILIKTVLNSNNSGNTEFNFKVNIRRYKGGYQGISKKRDKLEDVD